MWAEAGGGSLSEAKLSKRREHLEQQPKGCDSIEAFLAAGGVVYRE